MNLPDIKAFYERALGMYEGYSAMLREALAEGKDTPAVVQRFESELTRSDRLVKLYQKALGQTKPETTSTRVA